MNWLTDNRGGGRRLAIVALASLLAVAGFGPIGALQADAAVTVTAQLVGSPVDTSGWTPPPIDPSGIAWIPSRSIFWVTDNNIDNSGMYNAWEYTYGGGAVNRYTGIVEPTGVDYDPTTNTMFVSDDHVSKIFIIQDFDTSQESRIPIDTDAMGSGDTEDPAYDRANGVLFFINGHEAAGPGKRIFWIDPGADGDFGTGYTTGSIDIAPLNTASNADWEGLSWDPATGHLLAGNRLGRVIYELPTTGFATRTSYQPSDIIRTIALPTSPAIPTYISGLGLAPASYDSTKTSIWVTDRGTDKLYEYSFTAIPQQAPVANDQTLTATVGNSRPVTLSASDANGDPLTYTVTSGPSLGTYSGTPPNLTYTATSVGTDTIKFKANDGTADSNEGTITIEVSTRRHRTSRRPSTRFQPTSPSTRWSNTPSPPLRATLKATV